MSPTQELDSLPLSEAPRRAGPKSRAKTVPNQKFCEAHRVWFFFECQFCASSILGYGSL